MLEIFRSVIFFPDRDAESRLEKMRYNLKELLECDLVIPDEYGPLYKAIRDFAKEHGGSVPDIGYLKLHFETTEEYFTQQVLEEIAKENFLIPGFFHSRTQIELDRQREDDLHDAFLTASKILTEGKTLNGVPMRGNDAAVQFAIRRLKPHVFRDPAGKLYGSIREEAREVIAKYERKKADRRRGVGQLTGFPEIDNVCRGLKKGELHLHLGFPGELKTTFCLNYAYNQAQHYGWNVCYVNCETERSVARDIFYILHSANPMFTEDRRPLTFEQVYYAELTPDEEDFFRQVVDDFESNPTYGDIQLLQLNKVTSVSELRTKVELLHQEKPIDLLIIDEARYLISDMEGWHRQSYTIQFNQVIRELKLWALYHDRGNGIPMVSPFQANRAGKEKAAKNDGHYDMSAFSYANEAEKAADLLTYTYLDDDLIQEGEVKIGCLKNRSLRRFAQFRAKVLPASRKMMSPTEGNQDISGDL